MLTFTPEELYSPRVFANFLVQNAAVSGIKSPFSAIWMGDKDNRPKFTTNFSDKEPVWNDIVTLCELYEMLGDINYKYITTETEVERTVTVNNISGAVSDDTSTTIIEYWYNTEYTYTDNFNDTEFNYYSYNYSYTYEADDLSFIYDAWRNNPDDLDYGYITNFTVNWSTITELMEEYSYTSITGKSSSYSDSLTVTTGTTTDMEIVPISS